MPTIFTKKCRVFTAPLPFADSRSGLSLMSRRLCSLGQGPQSAPGTRSLGPEEQGLTRTSGDTSGARGLNTPVPSRSPRPDSTDQRRHKDPSLRAPRSPGHHSQEFKRLCLGQTRFCPLSLSTTLSLQRRRVSAVRVRVTMSLSDTESPTVNLFLILKHNQMSA